MIIYRNAIASDMPQVAKTHIACFEGYFLSSLGEQLLEKYYLEFLIENDLFIVAEDEETHKIIGFCMGYYKGSNARSNFESKYKLMLTKKLLMLCLKFNKAAISKCIAKVVSVFKAKGKSENSFKADSDLLSIGVLSECRGQGVAKALVEAFEKRIFENAGERKIKNCTLSVFSDNSRARAFYEKMGFTIFSDNGTESKYIKYF